MTDPKTPIPAPQTLAELKEWLKTIPETGGPQGAEPTRYNDWEKNGRVSDF